MCKELNKSGTRVCVVYHSGFGHTSYLAKAVRDGVDSIEGVASSLIYVDDVEEHWEELATSDGMVFGCPTYMGAVSAPFKAFMDATSRIWLEQRWKNKVAAGFTNSGNQSGDKLATLYQLLTFAMQHGMIWSGLNVPGGNNSTKGSKDDLNQLGSWVGAMAQSNMDQGIDGISKGDLLTAQYLGKRVALVARNLIPINEEGTNS